MMHFIVDAVPKDNYILELKFRIGEVRLLDMNPYIREGGVFGKLRDKSKFREVRVQRDLGGLEMAQWSGFLSEYCVHEVRAAHREGPLVSQETDPRSLGKLLRAHEHQV